MSAGGLTKEVKARRADIVVQDYGGMVPTDVTGTSMFAWRMS